MKAEQVQPPTYLTTNDLAALLRTSPATCRYWVHMGTGPKSFRVGRRRLYDRADVTEWIAAQRAATGGAA